MIELNSKQRMLIADKLFDVANVGVGGMVFGQFLSDQPFSVLLALTGLGIWVSYSSSALRSKEGPANDWSLHSARRHHSIRDSRGSAGRDRISSEASGHQVGSDKARRYSAPHIFRNLIRRTGRIETHPARLRGLP